MAAYKYTVTKVTQSCGNCHQVLFQGNAEKDIGSPVLRCPHCSALYRNPYRFEWQQYPNKTLVYFKPLIFALIGAFAGFLVGKTGSWTAVGAVIFLLIGLGFSVSDLIKISASNQRMKNPQHLSDMHDLGILDDAAYRECCQKAGIAP